MKQKIYALGFFDGVHLGHQALLTQCRRLAEENGCDTAAITFRAHPQSLFTDAPPMLINSCEDRQRLLTHYGMHSILQYPVTAEVMSTSWENFLINLIEQGAVGFVCGDDFSFGYKGQGNPEKLQTFCAERGMPCVIVPEQAMDGIRISSSYIRNLLEQGDVETAAAFLGHPHILSGEVVPGQQLGRELGFPTANIQLPQTVVCPKFGVYACKVRVDGEIYPAVANVGIRPTVSGQNITVEPWILNFDRNLYGHVITLEFHHFLRPEQKFASLDRLQAQIQRDAAQASELLG